MIPRLPSLVACVCLLLAGTTLVDSWFEDGHDDAASLSVRPVHAPEVLEHPRQDRLEDSSRASWPEEARRDFGRARSLDGAASPSLRNFAARRRLAADFCAAYAYLHSPA